MRKTTSYLAAALALGTISVVPAAFGADEAAANNKGSSNQPQAGNSGQQTADISGVRDLLARATDAAVQENGFHQFLSDFAGHHRGETAAGAAAGAGGEANAAAEGATHRNTGQNQASDQASQNGKSAAAAGERIAGNTGSDQANNNEGNRAEMKKLEDQVNQFRKDWKEKYNADFQISNPAMVYSDITASDLRAMEPQQAASELRGSARTPDNQNGGGAVVGKSEANAGAENSGAANRAENNGMPNSGQRERMTLTLPEKQNSPAVQVHLVRIGDTYKFARTRNFDRKELADNLSKQLEQLEQNKAQWPADANAASCIVTRHVLMAIQETQGNTAMPAGAHLQGESSSPSR